MSTEPGESPEVAPTGRGQARGAPIRGALRGRGAGRASPPGPGRGRATPREEENTGLDSSELAHSAPTQLVRGFVLYTH
jgi:hypothetical protein